MEFNYSLNYDCIFNFEFAEYYVYFKILLINKTFFSRIHDVSKLNISFRSQQLSPFEFHIFPNLTYLELRAGWRKKYVTFDHNSHILAYEKKINKSCSLQTLKIFDGIYLQDDTELINLKSLLCLNRTISSKIINKCSQLTSLTFIIPLIESLKDFELLNNLKVLNVQGYFHDKKFVNYQGLNYLESLTLNFVNADNPIPINIKYSNLSYLNISSRYTLYINLDKCMKLKHLQLSNAYFRDINGYLKKTPSIQVLRLKEIRRYHIELSNEDNYNLKHLETDNVVCFIKNRLMKLQTCEMKLGSKTGNIM